MGKQMQKQMSVVWSGSAYIALNVLLFSSFLINVPVPRMFVSMTGTFVAKPTYDLTVDHDDWNVWCKHPECFL